MPIIPQYDAPAGLVPRPTDMAVSTAREVGAVGNRLIREEGEAVGGAVYRAATLFPHRRSIQGLLEVPF